MGTPFIITVFAIIVVCIAIAIIVAGLMRTNSGLDNEESGQAGAPLVPSDDSELHSPTGPLPSFMPHQTQPLSEIYYYNEQVQGLQPSAQLTSLDLSGPPAQSTLSEPPAPHMLPPTGPLPDYQ